MVRELNSGGHRGIPASWANDPADMTPLQIDRTTTTSGDAESSREPHIGSREASQQAHIHAQQSGDAHTAQAEEVLLPSQLTQPSDIPPEPRPQETVYQRNNGSYQQIKIAALNLKGHGSLRSDKNNKWKTLSAEMMQNKIGIHFVMETHLTADSTSFLNEAYEKNLKIINSPDPENPAAKGGIAVVLNKRFVTSSDVKCTVIIPGRAILVSLKRPGAEELCILGVYAPNVHTENREFWRKIKRKWEDLGLPKLHLVIGDTNIVEDSIDRDPAHHDNAACIEALSDLTESQNLVEGWRKLHPDAIAYSYVQDHREGRARSRIDRIYIAKEMFENESDDWIIQDTAVKTDHKRIAVSIRDLTKPKLGKGRPTIQPFLVDNKRFVAEITKMARDTLNKSIEDPANTQMLFQELKVRILAKARATAKKISPILKQQVVKLQEQRAEVDNDPSLSQRDRSIQIDYIERNIRMKLETLSKREQDNKTVSYSIARDQGSKKWYKLKATSKPRDDFYELYIPGSETQETTADSEEMARIAAEYHNNVQSIDRAPRGSEEVMNAERITLEAAKERISEEEKALLDTVITETEVEAALITAKSNTAPGLDGIPVELWKRLYKNHKKDEDKGIDIVKLLTRVYNDVEGNGPHPESRFSDGWMCPIHKKKDKKDIANYRPITLLNTDYKLFTKALSTRVQMVAPKLLHPDQAGFMKDRSIQDQVRLLDIILPYAEKIALDGAIVALDQEKAYDKIDHAYMWKTLENANIPISMVNTIKSLYTNAHTSVMINGYLSAPFLITRGVRQGDPLSCLLFNIAIEPLACMLRDDPRLRGLPMPGGAGNLIVSLFADDTTVFLAKEDSFEALNEILNRWCLASTAKFNIGKTEIIPIGSTQHRQRVLNERTLNSTDTEKVQENIHIAKDQEPVRLLGGFIGNKIETQQIWSTQIEKLKDDYKAWGKRHLSNKEKRRVIQTFGGGRTQYQATGQGIPKEVQDRLNKETKKFWNENESGRGSIALQTLQSPIAVGGQGLLNFEDRNDAIEIMKIKSYLKSEQRPKWAAIYDYYLYTSRTTDSAKSIHTIDAAPNLFLQNWKVNSKVNLPPQVKNMLNIKTKYGITFEGLAPTQSVKERLPVWEHFATRKRLKRQTNVDKCLQQNHRIALVGEALNFINRVPPQNHRNNNNCLCNQCSADKEKGCAHPHKCAKRMTAYTNNIDQDWHPEKEPRYTYYELNDEEIAANAKAEENRKSEAFFDPGATLNKVSDGFRIFTKAPQRITYGLPTISPPSTTIFAPEATAYTDGSAVRDAEGKMRAGAGVWWEANQHPSMALRVPANLTQENNNGEILGMHIPASTVDRYTNLEIISDSEVGKALLTTNMSEAEDRGFIGVKNKTVLKSTIATMRQRQASTRLKWTKGHNGVEGNEQADRLAAEGAGQPIPANGKVQVIPKHLLLGGAKVSKITQALAYKGIQEMREHKREVRHSTAEQIKLIQAAIEDFTGESQSEGNIWKSMQKTVLTSKIRDFYYKATHNAYWVGAKWKHIEAYEDRAICQRCQVEESMDHILTKCESDERKVIWKLASELWLKKNSKWYEPSLGLILGAPAITIKTDDGVPDAGATRFFHILMTESAHAVWAIRCRRVIEHENDPTKRMSELEIRNHWTALIQNRLNLDKVQTNVQTFGHRALSEDKVLQTWRGTLKDEDSLPPNWVRQGGVLVGIG